MTTYRGKPDTDDKSQEGEVGYEGRAIEEQKEVFKGMCRFGDDAEDGNEDGTASDEKGAEDHPWREYVAEKESGKERVPKEGDCAERGENDDGKRGYLEYRAEEVGGDEYCCKE